MSSSNNKNNDNASNISINVDIKYDIGDISEANNKKNI